MEMSERSLCHKSDLAQVSFSRLRRYCEAENYKGWDPYDGLKSRVAHWLLPLKHSAVLRLCVIQGFKRCPVNLRRLALVPKEHNAKGIGLFLQGYCNLLWLARERGTEDETLLEAKVRELSELLVSLRSRGKYHGACWGYNFDWQARRLFLFPAHTPTVVATNFCATALLEAYELLKVSADEDTRAAAEEYKAVALTAAEFVLKDLHRYYPDEGDRSKFLFSYSILPGNDMVYNASLLGSRLLAYCYKYTKKQEYLDAARSSVRACVEGQREDGSWVYGLLPVQGWIDSFHTGYNLDALAAYEDLTGDTQFREARERGFGFYINNFFEADGTPKYYHNRVYPIDIHCPGQLFVTLSRLRKFDEHRPLAQSVLEWTIRRMQNPKGYFYYQLKRGISSKISYMRWSNAFMFCALTYYLKNTTSENI